ncbi:MAG: carbon-nitrogen hydrolase family protein [Anaerovoracaceae bacterium]|jgi:omega-amidase
MKFKLGLCQMPVVKEKEINLKKAEEMIREAALRGSQVISLPEIFNSPYSTKHFRSYAEDEKGQTVTLLSSLAKELSVYLIGGSIPEIADKPDGPVYNTSFAFDRQGNIIGKHRKIHLFDVDVEGGIRMKESDTLSAGDRMTVFDTEYGKIGIAICYDVRFPELIRNMALAGAILIVIPAAFSFATGVAHWDVTMRSRAIDNQVYFAAVSSSRDQSGHYQAYGHSCVVTPWGDFCAKTDFRESIVYADIDLDYIKSVRNQLPLLQHRRPDIYEKDKLLK